LGRVLIEWLLGVDRLALSGLLVLASSRVNREEAGTFIQGKQASGVLQYTAKPSISGT